MSTQKLLRHLIGIASILLLLVGCSAPAVVPPTASATPTSLPPTVAPTPPPTSTPTTAPADDADTNELSADTDELSADTDELSDEEVATLSSLEQIDDYPLYTMHYYGVYEEAVSPAEVAKLPLGPVSDHASPGSVRDRPEQRKENPYSIELNHPNLAASPHPWACSLFAVLGDADNMLYSRNFDWNYSPAVLLFTDPPDGYASVSMVDIAYLGFGQTEARALTDLSLVERKALLRTPFLPFDGFNEQGLAIGMAAVPPGEMRPDPEKETISSLMAIREMLDHASNVEEAVALLQNYNIDMQGGPPLHYLVADLSGRSALVEFYRGEMVVISNETPWHLATNFLRASAGELAEGRCWRYDEINQRLTEAQGQITMQGAMDLLAGVSQGSTQWSIVYGISTGDINVTMGRQYDKVHILHLSLAGE